MKKSKLLICALFVSLVVTALPGMESSAAEGETNAAASGLHDENVLRLQQVTAIDENGSIYQVDGSVGTVAGGSSEEAEDSTDTGAAEDADSSADTGAADDADSSTDTGEEESTGSGEGQDEQQQVPARSRMALFSAKAATTSSVKVVNFNTKGNAVTQYNNNTGYTNGAYGADAAYLGTDGSGNIRFMLAGVTGTVKASEVQLLDYSEVADNVSCYIVSNGKLYHKLSYNLNQSHVSSVNQGPAPSYLKAGVKYYSYDGHYFYTDYKTMLSDYQSSKNGASAVNAGNPFYNYFQFLDMNQHTSYTGEQLEAILQKAMKNANVDPAKSKLTGTGEIFVKYQDTYNVNALLSLAIAINETGWGTSSICMQKNNIFGICAYDGSAGTSAKSYASVEACIKDFMGSLMAKGYLSSSDYRNHGEYLGNKGGGINVSYASAPYWGEIAGALAWSLDSVGGSQDYLGIVPDDDAGSQDDGKQPEGSTGSQDDGKQPEGSTGSQDDGKQPEGDTGSQDDGKQPEGSTGSQDDGKQPEGSTGSQDDGKQPEGSTGSQDGSEKPVTSGSAAVTEEKPATQPKEDETSTQPKEDETSTQPKEDETSTQPREDEPSAKPEGEQTSGEQKEEKDQVREVSASQLGISVSGVLSEDAALTVQTVSPNTEKYESYISAEPVKGKEILGVYDISLSGTMEGEAQLTFRVDAAYNGRNVVILHYTDDGAYETYHAQVKDGQITLSVKGFSPYVIALDDNADGAAMAPQTGVSENGMLWLMLMGMSACAGIFVIRRRRAKG